MNEQLALPLSWIVVMIVVCVCVSVCEREIGRFRGCVREQKSVDGADSWVVTPSVGGGRAPWVVTWLVTPRA